MAYKLTDTSSQYLSSSSAPATAAPLTVSAWFRVDNTAGNKAVVTLRNDSTGHRFMMYIGGSTPLWLSQGSTLAQASGSAVSANTWTHGCGVEVSATSRYMYINGTAGLQNTTSATPSGVAKLYIGANASNSTLMTGQIADVGIWTAALDAAEIASLAKGVSARLVRPQSLVFYAPLIRDLVDEMRALTITNNNTATAADHPRIYA